MSRNLVWVTALALSAGFSLAGSAGAAPCRDAKGQFVKCPAVSAPAKPAKCRDAKGHFAKCEVGATTAAVKK